VGGMGVDVGGVVADGGTVGDGAVVGDGATVGEPIPGEDTGPPVLWVVSVSTVGEASEPGKTFTGRVIITVGLMVGVGVGVKEAKGVTIKYSMTTSSADSGGRGLSLNLSSSRDWRLQYAPDRNVVRIIKPGSSKRFTTMCPCALLSFNYNIVYWSMTTYLDDCSVCFLRCHRSMMIGPNKGMPNTQGTVRTCITGQ
jgi:hypothetical protein